MKWERKSWQVLKELIALSPFIPETGHQLINPCDKDLVKTVKIQQMWTQSNELSRKILIQKKIMPCQMLVQSQWRQAWSCWHTTSTASSRWSLNLLQVSDPCYKNRNLKYNIFIIFQTYSYRLKKTISSFKKGRLFQFLPWRCYVVLLCTMQQFWSRNRGTSTMQKMIPYLRPVGWGFGMSIWIIFLCILLFVFIKKNFTTWLVTE